MSKDEQVEEQEYVPPRIVELGSLADLTLAAGGSGVDFNGRATDLTVP